MPLAATLTGLAVPVAGPLLVLSERVGAEQISDDHEIEIRRVSLYDVSTDKYWPAFDYRNVRLRKYSVDRSAVQPAGTHLIVWSRDQVARVALNGQIETVLFENAEIRTMKVSPDETNVAILFGQPGTLVVLDAASGAERLRVASHDPDLKPLRKGGRIERLTLGNWHADGSALSITADTPSADLTAILGLDGAMRVLPEEGWHLSPDLRFALRVGEIFEFRNHNVAWESWDVIDVETERLLWTIADDEGIDWPYDNAVWLGESRYVAFRTPSIRHQVLDTATGESGPLSLEVKRMLLGPVLSSCGVEKSYNPSSHSPPCVVRYEGHVAWEGAEDWTWYLGRIDLPDGFTLQGVSLLDMVPDPVPPPPPPPREAMVGPLLVYESELSLALSADQYEQKLLASEIGDYISGAYSESQTRRVIVYDEGTGRHWSLFEYSGSRQGEAVQLAHNGLVAALDHGLLYVTPDGQGTPLAVFDERVLPYTFYVSPDGRKVVADLPDRDDFTVFALPSGDSILRVGEAALIAASGLVAPEGVNLYVGLASGRVARQSPWLLNSAAFRIRLGASDDHHSGWIQGGGTISLDGEIAFMYSSEFPRLVAPPGRGGTDCPENPAQSCRILLDGEVVGEGRWPTIIGVVEID